MLTGRFRSFRINHMNPLLDFIKVSFQAGHCLEASIARRKEYAENFSKEKQLERMSLSETLDIIDQHKLNMHKRGLSLNEAFEWIVLPLIIRNDHSADELKKHQEDFRKRFESPELLNAFDSSVNIKNDPGFWLVSGLVLFFIVVPILFHYLEKKN